jgi:hypothetical protein
MPDLQAFKPAVPEGDMNLECQAEVTVTARCLKLLTTFLWQQKYLLVTSFNPISHHSCKWLDLAPGRT